MFTITDIAAERIREILVAEGKAEWGLRIFKMDGGCCGPSFGMDIEQRASETDEVIEKNGLRVYIDRETYSNLTGMTLDFIEDGERQGFVLTGGNSSCGPGCSSCG